MPLHHRKIPIIPKSPHVRPIAGQINRSYQVGRHNFTRACQGEYMTLTISSDKPFPENIKANIVTTMSSNNGKEWNVVPFERENAHTLVCRIASKHSGLHSFRAEFSLDNGASWHRDSVPDAWVLIDPPQVDGLCVYTLLPNVSGTFTDWKKDLKRIRDMGFNAVHLLPLTAMDTSESPYSAKDLFEVDPSYVDKSLDLDGLGQLEEFIEEAKSLNMRLIFDIVLNHIGVSSIMSQRAPDWIVPDPKQQDGFKRARCWTNHGWLIWEDLILINYEHPSESIRAKIWNYMIEYALFWAKYANDTGGFIRFDNLHSSDPGFVETLTKALHLEYPNVGVLAEYFTDETTLLYTGPNWGLNLSLATPWDYKFVPQLREYLNYIHRVSKHIRYFMPVTSHDSGTPAQEFGNVESTIPRYIAAALLGTGATGIVQGVEYGVLEKINFIGRRTKMQFPSEPKFSSFIKKINNILNDYSVFRQGDNCHFVDNEHEAIIAAYRKENGTQAYGFLIACNFDIFNPHLLKVDLSSILEMDGPFPCTDLLTNQTQIFAQAKFEITLPPSSVQVLRFLNPGELWKK